MPRHTLALLMIALSAPLVSNAADLRAGVMRYDGGAALYGVGQTQQLICDNCPSGPGLVPAPPRPAIRYEPREVQPLEAMDMPQDAPEDSAEKTEITSAAPKRLTVFFGFDKATLTGEEQKRIREALAGGVDSSVTVRVDGYTCKVGGEAYNKNLSKRRAKAVAVYLRKLGIKVATAEGQGKKHHKGAVVPKDRRAEIVIKERN